MYLCGIVIYGLFPTTCVPGQFMPGNMYINGYENLYYTRINTSWDWGINSLFQGTLKNLANDSNNVFGSAPSYHNFWAAILVFFGILNTRKWWIKTICIFFGVLLSISTLTLHQHNLFDVGLTYCMTGLGLWLINKYKWDDKISNCFNKLFKVK
jgi:hypothetical protein